MYGMHHKRIALNNNATCFMCIVIRVSAGRSRRRQDKRARGPVAPWPFMQGMLHAPAHRGFLDHDTFLFTMFGDL